jgi:hypothetical protein
MGSFRFYRRVHIFPGASINFSKSGPSLTLGVRGAHVTLGQRGITKTVGLPGSGLYYTSRNGTTAVFIRRMPTHPLARRMISPSIT